MNFGERLQHLRKEKGLSQEEFAELLHVSRQTISRWETSQTTPDLLSIEKMCDIFHLSYDELLDHQKSGSKKKYFSYLMILPFVCLFIISFFLPSNNDQNMTSTITFTPSMLCCIISIIGMIIAFFLIYKNHRN